MEFLSTPVYPCHVQLIRGWMPVEEAARGFWLLGLSSRTGDVLSKLGYGSLLAVLSWQQLTWCAAGVALGAAVLGGLAHRDSPYARDAPGTQISPSELRLVLRHILSSGQFWLGAAAVSSIKLLTLTPHPDPNPNPSPTPTLSLTLTLNLAPQP